jgi:hypothetical protein
MAVRKWIVIIFAVIGVFVVGLMVLAGAGAMWVGRHININQASSSDAIRTFDQERARFKDEKPLITADDLNDTSGVQRRVNALPASSTKPTEMAILVWDPDEQRTVRIALPFWLLKIGKRKIDIGASTFDFERFRLDVNDLERIGPRLIADFQRPGGERVLLWTR